MARVLRGAVCFEVIWIKEALVSGISVVRSSADRFFSIGLGLIQFRLAVNYKSAFLVVVFIDF